MIFTKAGGGNQNNADKIERKTNEFLKGFPVNQKTIHIIITTIARLALRIRLIYSAINSGIMFTGLLCQIISFSPEAWVYTVEVPVVSTVEKFVEASD